MTQIIQILHQGKKIFSHSKKQFNTNKARNYLFLTLGSTFIFGILYYIVQFLDRQTQSIKSQESESDKTGQNNGGIDEDGDSEEDKMLYKDGQLSFFSCLLFSLVTQTTVGFAWFIPNDQNTKILVFFQLISVLIITTLTLL